MSKYIKEWLFCESGNAYKLPEIVKVANIKTFVKTPEYSAHILIADGQYGISQEDYKEIINALKQREQDIAELLEVDIDDE